MDQAIADIEAPRRRGRWDFLFSWTGLFFVSWVAYEVTSQASLGVTIFCCKFGWNDFCTGFWLRQRDPVPERGKMELWIYIASGLCCTASMAIIMMLVIAVLAAAAEVPQPEDQLREAAITVLVGCAICTLTTMWALFLAWLLGRKLWLHPAMHDARVDDIWPPFPVRSTDGKRLDLHGQNMAGIVVGFVCVITVVALVAFAAVMAKEGVVAGDGLVLAVYYSIVFFGGLQLFWWLRDYQNRHLLAQSPEECWGADAVVEEL